MKVNKRLTFSDFYFLFPLDFSYYSKPSFSFSLSQSLAHFSVFKICFFLLFSSFLFSSFLFKLIVICKVVNLWEFELKIYLKPLISCCDNALKKSGIYFYGMGRGKMSLRAFVFYGAC